jgi:signal transduction histidine kinase/ligand-binding sensor domain-containing protein/CheY-like chemotaxis protein/AraC-like DNA-binding protein
MRNKLLVAILSLTFFSLHSSNVKLYSINSLYGISMREPASVCKDNKGFIWTSSKTGVLRLAGDDYHIYQLPYENADIISVKLVYTTSCLLAYTNNGQLFRYNEINDQFDLLVSMTKVLNNKYISVTRVLIDDSGCYWIATSFGLFRYQRGHLTFIQNSDEIDYLAWYCPNRLFVARPDGIWLLDKQTLKKKCLYRYRHKFDLRVSKFFYDTKAKRLWIGTLSSGLFYYDLNNHTMAPIQMDAIPKQPILAIEANSDSTILIGVDGQGLWELNKQGTKILNVYKEDINNPSSLRGNGVYDIFNDQNKRIWVCTYSGGVSFFDQTSPLVDQLTHTINNPNSLVNNNVNKIIQDKRGNIWFATDNGISCKEAGTGNWKTFYQNKLNQAPVFVSLCEDDNGRIWAGSYSSGIYVLDERTGRELAHYSKETHGLPLGTNFVLDIFKDSRGDLWIGGGQGNFICYLTKENKFRNYSQQPIYAFAELSPNQLLLACTYGLCLLDKKSGKITTLQDGYLVQDVTSLNGEIWICTSGEGLIRYNPKNHKTQKITTASGLPSNYVNSIMYADGYLWLGTESGLCRLNPKNMDVLTYNAVYQLSRVSFNRNSHCRLSDGQLIWGTSNGAVRFSPKLLTETQSKGAVFFQDLTLAGRSIRASLSTPLDSLQKLSLNYSQNTLHLELLSIGNVSGAKFSWILDGFDNSWSQPSGNRSIQYSNIPSGHYVLKIRLYDSSLSQIISERTLFVTVVPPFWKAWWFEILLFAFIVGIFYISLKYYIERLKQQHTEEKVRFFTNTAHDFRTSLTLVKAPIEELTKEKNLSDTGRYYLSLAIEQTRRLSTVVTQLMDFQKVDIKKEQLALSMVDIVSLIEHRRAMFDSIAKSQNVDLHFDSDQEEYQTAVDESMMEKVIDNLISNAIKYSHSGNPVQINLRCEPDSWTLEVKDNGIGISNKAKSQLFREFYRGENAINSKIVGSGIGLLLVKNYVEMHDGNISYVSEENVGSDFKIVIPFKEALEETKKRNTEKQELVPGVVTEVDLQPLLLQKELPKQEMRILIVEDNDDLRNFMQHPLQADFDVLLAEDGAEAWDIIQKQMPDLVVSDVMMPRMDGFELCRLMKSTYETSHIPVILLTALSGKVEQLHGLGLGADDYLTKPFDMTLLVQRIKSIIRNREVVKEKALKLIKGSVNDNEQILANEHNDQFVKKILEVIRANMANAEFGKDDFASAMNVSTSLLYKKIKSLTNQSPTDFIKMVRLDYALELLQSHKYSVTEVSELCGFSSIGYFSTVFKKYFGKSPTDI